jgi:hypothetical protein
MATSVKVMMSAKAGKNSEAEATIQHAIEIGRGYAHFHHTSCNIAPAYALMNEPEQAMKWLQVTVDEGFPNYPLFEGDARLDNLRKDPRLLHLWRSRSSSGSWVRGHIVTTGESQGRRPNISQCIFLFSRQSPERSRDGIREVVMNGTKLPGWRFVRRS